MREPIEGINQDERQAAAVVRRGAWKKHFVRVERQLPRRGARVDHNLTKKACMHACARNLAT